MFSDLVEVRVDLVLGEAAEGGVVLGHERHLQLRLLQLLRQYILQARDRQLHCRLLALRHTLLQLLVQPVVRIVFLGARTRAKANVKRGRRESRRGSSERTRTGAYEVAL